MEAIKADLLGKKLTLKFDSDQDVAQETVDLVVSKVRDIQKRDPSQFAQDILLVAILELAEEYTKSKRRVMDYKSSIQEKTDLFIESIDSCIVQ